MAKSKLIKQIIARLHESLALLDKAARASHDEATHESSKAESKYDTRGLEAAYLAGGQARQAREILDSIEEYQVLPGVDFAPGEPIDLAAVVELESGDSRSFFFIGPKHGGLEVQWNGKEVTVVTPQSPLGSNLCGRKEGDCWTAQVGGAKVKYRIISVS